MFESQPESTLFCFRSMLGSGVESEMIIKS